MRNHPLVLLCLGIFFLSCGPGSSPGRLGQGLGGEMGAGVPDGGLDVGVDVASATPAAGTISAVVPVVPAGCAGRASCVDSPASCSGPTVPLSVTMVPGTTYRLTVRGTYIGGYGDKNCNPGCLVADARYHRCSDQIASTPWTDEADGSDFRGGEHFDLQIWDGVKYATPTWIEPYNEAHVYTTLVTAQSDTLRLQVNDPDAGDNGGELQVELTPVACGGVGESCCPGNACNPAGVCDGTTNTCLGCGGAGQPACQESCQTRGVTATGEEQAITVRAGQVYQLAVNGTVDAGNGVTADAWYQSTGGGTWTESTAHTLQIWDVAAGTFVSPAWGAYTADHRYVLLWTAPSDTLRVRFNDTDPGDNRGALGLEVCPARCGAAGQACCWGSTCVAGTSCDAAGQCGACGGSGEPACPAACTTVEVDPRRFPTDTAVCPAASQVPVVAGLTYRLAASGTYQARSDVVRIVADARYNRVDDGLWTDIENGGNASKGARFLDLQLRNGISSGPFVSPEWGAFSADHRYSVLWRATSNALCLRTYDDSPDDDVGSVRVEVCPIVCGAPGQACCADGGCEAGNACDDTNHCAPCGGVGQPMCCGQQFVSASPQDGSNTPQEVAISLSPGVRYQVTARGMYVEEDLGNFQVLADALCVFDGRENTPAWSPMFRDQLPEYLDLQVGSGTGYGSPYAVGTLCDTATHAYAFAWTAPSDGVLRLRINDDTPTSSTGGLTVSYCVTDPADCNDGNACTTDTIDNGRCVHTAAPAGTVCRAASGSCDVAEVCNGTSKVCPADGFVSAGTVCRSAAGSCDVAEACTGSSGQCPADALVSAGTTCRAASSGGCDVAEACTGSATTCPADGFRSAGFVCRSAAGVCDVAEACSGSSGQCPADALVTAGTVCRAGNGTCDPAETCTGSATSCPNNVFAQSGIACNDGQSCTSGDTCNSSGQCVGTPGSCNDSNPCTSDSGNTCTGCVNTPLTGTACNDGQSCTSDDTCNSSGQCVGTARPCNDGNACTADSCSPANGQCVYSPLPPGTPCNDNNPNTVNDQCSGAGGCSGVPVCIPTPEVCNGVDDDCDGVVDENNPGGGQSCSTGQPGICGPGTTACSSGTLVCNRNQGPQPELCNNIDDNCNGSTDESLGTTTCGVGACQRTVQNCVNGTTQTCAPGSPTTEICGNGVDENCNGIADDGCNPPTARLYTVGSYTYSFCYKRFDREYVYRETLYADGTWDQASLTLASGGGTSYGAHTEPNRILVEIVYEQVLSSDCYPEEEGTIRANQTGQWSLTATRNGLSTTASFSR